MLKFDSYSQNNKTKYANLVYEIIQQINKLKT